MPLIDYMFGSTDAKSTPLGYGINGSYLLDNIPGAAAAVCIRKLRSNYTGNCLRVRRSSDNTELDIGFGSDGVIDTGTLLNFAGNGSAFVTSWYGQAENGLGAGMGNAVRQPRIVNSGALEMINNHPALRWYQNGCSLNFGNFSSLALNSTKPLSFLSVNSLTKQGNSPRVIQKSAAYSLFAGTAVTFSGWSLFNTNGGVINNQSDSVPFNDICTGNLILNEFHCNKNILVQVYHNNINYGTVGNVPSLANSNFNVNIGNRDSYDRTALNGLFCEVIFYPTDQTPNRNLLVKNINGYYQIF